MVKPAMQETQIRSLGWKDPGMLRVKILKNHYYLFTIVNSCLLNTYHMQNTT